MRMIDLFERVRSPHLDTASFRQWFGASKVVDAQGAPLPVFHGSFEDFREFKRESEKRRAYGINRLGFWFDEHPDTASYFAGFDAKRANHDTAQAGTVLAAYLSIKRPLVFSSEPVWHEDEKTLAGHAARGDYGSFNRHVDQMDRQDSYDHMLGQIPKPEVGPGRNPMADRRFEANVEAYREQAIEQGYDGIYLPDTYADAGTRGGRLTNWWIAFHPEQIKAVLGNSGGFDPSNPDITR